MGAGELLGDLASSVPVLLGHPLPKELLQATRLGLQLLTAQHFVDATSILAQGDPSHVETLESLELLLGTRSDPKPDLRPLRLDGDWIDALRAALPELPFPRALRLEAAHALDRDAIIRHLLGGGNWPFCRGQRTDWTRFLHSLQLTYLSLKTPRL